MDFLDNKKFANPNRDPWKNAVGDWAGLAGVVVGGAKDIILSSQQTKATNTQADAIKYQSAASVEVARINAEAALALANSGSGGAAVAPKKGLSTGAIVGLSLGGVVLLGVMIWGITR